MIIDLIVSVLGIIAGALLIGIGTHSVDVGIGVGCISLILRGAIA